MNELYEKVKQFFKEDPECFWTQTDLINEFEVPQAMISQALTKLEENGEITSWKLEQREVNGPRKMWSGMED